MSDISIAPHISGIPLRSMYESPIENRPPSNRDRIIHGCALADAPIVDIAAKIAWRNRVNDIDFRGQRNWAQAVYNFRWTPQTDPFGVVHKIIDYPGVPVDHSTVQETRGILKNVRIPIRPARDLQKVLHRSRVARCLPQDARFPDEH